MPRQQSPYPSSLLTYYTIPTSQFETNMTTIQARALPPSTTSSVSSILEIDDHDRYGRDAAVSPVSVCQCKAALSSQTDRQCSCPDRCQCLSVTEECKVQQSNTVALPTLPQTVSDHDPFATSILHVKAGDLDTRHWHLLRRHVGNKRQCIYCKKKGINEYKGEIFFPDGVGEVNQCLRCHRMFVQIPKPSKPPKAIATSTTGTMIPKPAGKQQGNSTWKKLWLKYVY